MPSMDCRSSGPIRSGRPGNPGIPFWPFSRTLPITYSGPEVARTPFSKISVTTSVMTLR